MSMRHIVGHVGVVLLLAGSIACTFTPASSGPRCPAGAHCIETRWYLQRDVMDNDILKAYCVPASITMWANFENRLWGGVPDDVDYQRKIWARAENAGWTAYMPSRNYIGIRYTAIPELAKEYAGVFPFMDEYLDFEKDKWTYLADMDASYYNNHPSIAVMSHGTHAVLFVGGDWNVHGLQNARPSVNTVIYHDPASSAYVTLFLDAFWADCWIEGAGFRSINLFQHHTSTKAVADFQALGGTYIGDPNPPMLPPWPMSEDSAVTGCSSYSELSCVYKATPATCYDYCAVKGAKGLSGNN